MGRRGNALFPLPIAACARARHSLPALDRALLLTPSLREEKIRKACGGGRDITMSSINMRSFSGQECYCFKLFFHLSVL